MDLDEQKHSAGNGTPERNLPVRPNDGIDGAESPVHHALDRDREGEKLRDEIGPPVSDTWQRVEDELSEAEEDAKREALRENEAKREALRQEEENKRLIPLRLERLKKQSRKFSAEEMKAPLNTMLSAGTERLWDVRQAITSENREREAAAEQLVYEKEYAQFGEAEANAREAEREGILNAQEWMTEAPLWQQISGLFPEEELGLHPGKRAAGIRRLLKRAEGLIRWEIRKGEAEREAGGTPAPHNDDGVVGAKSPDHYGDDPDHCVDATRRTAQWDPLRSICFYLGIAQRKLSALCREINGLAVTQLCDAIRAETLRKKWKKRLAEWVGTVAGKEIESAGRGDGRTLTDRAYEFYRKLKAERQKTGSHRSSFAWETGFSSYTRMFRACLVCYGLVPQEMEMLLIKEALGTPCVFGRGGEESCGLRDSDCRLDVSTPAEGNSIEN